MPPKRLVFPPLLCLEQRAASSSAEVHLAEVYIGQQTPPLAPGYRFTEFYKLEIIWHVRFYSELLFVAPKQPQKKGACIAAVMGHGIRQDWGNWDVCGVTANCLHGTGGTAGDGS